MPIRRGEEYLESLRDGRRLWVMGQRVEDVTTHAALAGCARSVAAVYDLQHDPAHQDLLTMPSPSTGQPVSLSYLLARIGERSGAPAAHVRVPRAPGGRRGGALTPASGDGRARAL